MPPDLELLYATLTLREFAMETLSTTLADALHAYPLTLSCEFLADHRVQIRKAAAGAQTDPAAWAQAQQDAWDQAWRETENAAFVRGPSYTQACFVAALYTEPAHAC